MINREHDLPIKRQAELLGMSRGSVYYLPRPVSEADLALMRRIDLLHLEHPFMGARMLRDQLERQGLHVGRRHVATLMRRMGIEALAPQPGTSKRAPGHKIYPYLLRKLAITRANQVWALDTTYIQMARGFVYLTAVVDVNSRKVLAHKVAITLEAIHAKEVIEQAFARYGTPEIVNTDQGSQFTAVEFTDLLLGYGWICIAVICYNWIRRNKRHFATNTDIGRANEYGRCFIIDFNGLQATCTLTGTIRNRPGTENRTGTTFT